MKFKVLAILALLFGMTLPASASPSLTHKGTNSGTTTSVSVTGLTISNNDLVLVGGAFRLAANADTVTITDTAGDTFTYYEYPTGGTTSIRTFIAFAKTTGLSAGSVTMTTSGSAPLVMALSVEDVSNFDTTTIEDTSARNTSQATSSTPNITSGSPTYSADLFYSSFSYGNFTYTEDGTWTNTANGIGNTNTKGATAYIIGSGTSTVTRTGSASGSGNWRGLVVGIKAAGSSTPVFHGLSAIGAGK